MRSWLIVGLVSSLGVGCGASGASSGGPANGRPASFFPPVLGAPSDVAASRGLCPMAQLTTGEQRLRVTLEGDVLFDTAKWDLKPAALEILKKVKTTVIDAHPDSKIDVEGHTDDRASDQYNQGLSDRRAASVASWLEQNGIASGRITKHGYGETSPRVPNDSDASRAKNRRVEIVVEWGPFPVATKSSCPTAQACCDLGSPAGCIGMYPTAPVWGNNLSASSLEDDHGVLRINPCVTTRSAAVWITSTDERKVAKLDERDGTEIFRVETYGAYPQRTAVASDGSVWITNRNSGSYVHIAADGKPLCSSKYGVCQTRAAAVDARGFPWIGCHDTGELIRVDPSATVGTVEVENRDGEKKTLPQCKELGRIKVEKVSPYGLAADREGGLWVGVDGGSIAKIDTNGLRVIGVYDPQQDPAIQKAGECWSPYGITIDHDGNPWFANTSCQNVVKIDGKSGKVIGLFGGGPKGMKGPRALGVDRRGHVWVSENASHFVDELEPDGTWVRQVDLQACNHNPGPLGAAADSEGDIWVALQGADKVAQIRPDGTLVGCYPDGKKTPLFQNPYTYSDFTGATLAAATPMGKTRVRFEHATRVSWRMLSFRAATPAGTSLCVRARAADSPAALPSVSWGGAECPKSGEMAPGRIALGGKKPVSGRVLEVEFDLTSSDPAVTPMISDLTAAATP